MFLREAFPEGFEGQGRDEIHQVNFAVHQELQQADAGAVVEHVVRLGIHGDFVHPVECGVERGEAGGGID